MGQHEAITSIDDREIISGPGNWTGDITDITDGIHVVMGVGEVYKEFSLSFPALDTSPEKGYSLTFKFKGLIVGGEGASPDAFLIDVSGQVISPLILTGDYGTWQTAIASPVTPAAWDPSTASFLINISSLGNFEIDTFFNYFSLINYFGGRKDHILLMGVH